MGSNKERRIERVPGRRIKSGVEGEGRCGGIEGRGGGMETEVRYAGEGIEDGEQNSRVGVSGGNLRELS